METQWKPSQSLPKCALDPGWVRLPRTSYMEVLCKSYGNPQEIFRNPMEILWKPSQSLTKRALDPLCATPLFNVHLLDILNKLIDLKVNGWVLNKSFKIYIFSEFLSDNLDSVRVF